MKPIVDDVTARAEIALWAEALEIELNEAVVAPILPAVRRGRITFDETAMSFRIALRVPVELANGTKLETLSIREPKTSELRSMGKTKDEMEMMIGLLSVLSGEPVGVIDRIGQKDLLVLGGVFNFFG